jgi:hypothetical protein
METILIERKDGGPRRLLRICGRRRKGRFYVLELAPQRRRCQRSSACGWSTCRATTAASTRGGRRRPRGAPPIQPVRESPTWKAARPKTGRLELRPPARARLARAESKPRTRSRSFEGKVKGDGGPHWPYSSGVAEPNPFQREEEPMGETRPNEAHELSEPR